MVHVPPGVNGFPKNLPSDRFLGGENRPRRVWAEAATTCHQLRCALPIVRSGNLWKARSLTAVHGGWSRRAEAQAGLAFPRRHGLIVHADRGRCKGHWR